MIDRNLSYECEITDLTVNGDGLAKIENYPLFISGAVPGDTVVAKPTKLNKSYGFAKLIRIISPSEHRADSVCRSFPKCGGCSFMHMSYDRELKYKSDFVLSNLKKIGGLDENDFIYEPIIAADREYNYRNKAQFPLKNTKHGAVCGFYESKSHSVIPCDFCNIQNETINSAINIAMDYINKNKIPAYDEKSHKGIIRHIYARYSEENGELMLVLVTNSTKPLKNTGILAERLNPLGLKSLVQNVNTKKTNVILGDKNLVLYGNDYIIMQADGLKFKLSPHSFFQVNTMQMKKLYKKAMEYADLKGTETVFDLYCGVGSISLFMAKGAKRVVGVEIVPDAIENAKENARLNNIGNAEFYCGDCTEVVGKLIDKSYTADVVIVDPPRKGCDEALLHLINQISPEKLVYISCNSATLARDAARLSELGFSLKKCTAADLFPKTVHCETVALLSRQKVTEHIYIDVNIADLPKTTRTTATYPEIKAYIKDKYGLCVSSLNIAQIKEKHGFEKRENYNKGKEGHRVPKCPPEKEKAIEDAFKHFGML